MQREAIEAATYADLVAPEVGPTRVGPARLLIRPDCESLLFNRALDLGPAPSPELTRAVVARYRAAGVTRFWLQGGRPKAMSAAGLERYPRAWVALTRDAQTPVQARPTTLTIERARRAHAEGVADVLADAFDLDATGRALLLPISERPRWHVYVALEGARVVAAGAMFVEGELAYLAFAATAPSHRNRGAQSALLARRLGAARALGCMRVFTDTGEPVRTSPSPSLANLRRAGFEVEARRDNFGPPGTTWLRAAPAVR